MGSAKVGALAGGMILVFLSVAGILWKVIPGPHKGTDYLVIGTLATFAALGLLFVVLLKTVMRDPTAFTKRPKT